MGANPALRFEVEKSSDESTNRVTTIKCHGKLITDTAGQMREQIKPLIPLEGASWLTLPIWSIWTARALAPW